MSKPTDGRAAYTGANIIRGVFAVRSHTYKPNTIRKLRLHCVFTRIDENALATIDATARAYGLTRGEAIAQIIRECRSELFELNQRITRIEEMGA